MMKEIEVSLTRTKRKSINFSCGIFPVLIKTLTYDLDRHLNTFPSSFIELEFIKIELVNAIFSRLKGY